MSDEPTTVSEAIEQGALEPKSASGDAGSVTGRDLRELIEADRYIKNQAAAQSRTTPGLRMFKIVNPGAS